jgi:hypothetical protein
MNPHNLFLHDMLVGGLMLLTLQLSIILVAVISTLRAIRKEPFAGIVLGLLYGVLMITLLLSSGRGILANKFFVTEITDNQVTCNSSVTLGGYDVTFELTAETPVYDVGTEGITCGIPGVIKEQDQITVVAGKDGSILAVFVYPYAQPGDLYWSVSRKYDSVVRRTTREPDVAGFYTYEMLCNGQQVTVQTRDYEVASQMDSFNAPCMGLTFDENGYVIEAVHATKVTEGRVFASYSRVMQVSGNMLYTAQVELNAKKHKFLDLGTVGQCAQVRINGKDIGARPFAPYRFDITNAIKDGENTLEITVANTCVYEQPDNFSRHMLIKPSGLLGPVKV